MGIIKLARWKEGDAAGVETLRDTILRGYNGKQIGFWRIHLHSYRSGSFPSRSIFAASTHEHTYAIIEDTSSAIIQPSSSSSNPNAHPRISYVTLPSPDALPPLLAMIAGNWTAARTNAAVQNNRAGLAAGGGGQTQLVLEGVGFSVGTDWIVRIGVVRQGQQNPRGVFIEVEYLPLTEPANTSIAAEFLAALAKKSGAGGEKEILSVQLDEAIWATVAKSPENPIESSEVPHSTTETKMEEESGEDSYDDLFLPPDEPTPVTETTSRERRSAFLILRCLQGEGLL